MVEKIKNLTTLPELISPVKPLAWPALYAVLMVLTLHDYLPWEQANFWLGLLALGCYVYYPTNEKANYRFLILAFLFTGLYLWLPVKTIFFFALIAGFFYAVEVVVGKLSPGILGIALLMSPVSNYAAEVFSFPIRLELSSWAAVLFRWSGTEAMAQGNAIKMNGALFEVDPACVGLNMLISSMLIGLLSIWLFEKKLQQRLPARYVPLILLVFFAANVAANILRILCLSYFQILPENPMHEVWGILCWLVYGVLPCLFLVRHLVAQVGTFERVEKISGLRTPVLPLYALSQLALLFGLSGIVGTSGLRTEYGIAQPSPEREQLTGFSKKKLPDGITAFSNGQALIYIKPIRGFYSTDHNPAICWSGSGYVFKGLKETKMGSAKVYTAALRRNKHTLYTAWWYESGANRTISQWKWRKNNLQYGRPYYLVNITAANETALELAVENYMQERSTAKWEPQ